MQEYRINGMSVDEYIQKRIEAHRTKFSLFALFVLAFGLVAGWSYHSVWINAYRYVEMI